MRNACLEVRTIIAFSILYVERTFPSWQLWNAARLGIKWQGMLVVSIKRQTLFYLFVRFVFALYYLVPVKKLLYYLEKLAKLVKKWRLLHKYWWFHLHNLFYIAVAWSDLWGIPRMLMLSFLFWSPNLAIYVTHFMLAGCSIFGIVDPGITSFLVASFCQVKNK